VTRLEHAAEAERLIDLAVGLIGDRTQRLEAGLDPVTDRVMEWAELWFAAAQVHATLAAMSEDTERQLRARNNRIDPPKPGPELYATTHPKGFQQ